LLVAAQIEVTHMGTKKRLYKVKTLTDKGADALMFENEQEGREMSVAEYFEAQYKMR
jgi:hypothetical protein